MILSYHLNSNALVASPESLAGNEANCMRDEFMFNILAHPHCP